MTKRTHINAVVLFTEIQGAHSIECAPNLYILARVVGIPRMRYIICRLCKSTESKEHAYCQAIVAMFTFTPTDLGCPDMRWL